MQVMEFFSTKISPYQLVCEGYRELTGIAKILFGFSYHDDSNFFLQNHKQRLYPQGLIVMPVTSFVIAKSMRMVSNILNWTSVFLVYDQKCIFAVRID